MMKWNRLKTKAKTMKETEAELISSKFIKNRIKEFEGKRLMPYPDAYGYSIGYGHFIGTTIPSNFKNGITDKQAENLLIKDIKRVEEQLSEIFDFVNFQNQIDALVSLVYNIGSGNFFDGSIPDKIKNNHQFEVKKTILEYNKATINGKFQVVDALKKRREFEADLYLYHQNALFWSML